MAEPANGLVPLTVGDESNDTTQVPVPVQDQIHDRLEFFFNSLALPWQAPLPFPMHVGLDCAHNASTVELDVCSFIAGSSPESVISPYAYFDRMKFPWKDQPTVSEDLHTALIQAAVQAGFQITGDGTSYTKNTLAHRKKFPIGSTPPKGSITYLCSRYDAYYTSCDGQEHDIAAYRGVSLHNNEKGNSRGKDGKKAPRTPAKHS